MLNRVNFVWFLNSWNVIEFDTKIKELLSPIRFSVICSLEHGRCFVYKKPVGSQSISWLAQITETRLLPPPVVVTCFDIWDWTIISTHTALNYMSARTKRVDTRHFWIRARVIESTVERSSDNRGQLRVRTANDKQKLDRIKRGSDKPTHAVLW